MGLETSVSGGLVIRAGAALVNLAQDPSSYSSLLPLQKAIALLYLNTTVILKMRWGKVVYMRAYLDTQKVEALCERLAAYGLAQAVAPPIED